MILLAANPHQEHIVDIKKFCLAHVLLLLVTGQHHQTLPVLNSKIQQLHSNFLDQGGLIIDYQAQFTPRLQLSYGMAQKYGVLAFFAPNNNRYCYTVMSFGPSNTPAYYTAMMTSFDEEWDNLFLSKLSEMYTINGTFISISLSNMFYLMALP